MKTKFILFLIVLMMITLIYNPSQAMEKYDEVRIKEFPVAMQCWTFRNFTFEETLQKVKDLGIKYLEAYPGQKLSKNMPETKFNHDMTLDQIKWVKDQLKKYEITLVSYGVVGFDNTEESAEKVFKFAKQMRIRTIVTEPGYDDFSIIEKMVKKHNIRVGIHNHPTPSKYAHPQTVLVRIAGLDERIGVCGDTGHWMRSSVNPVEALWLLRGRLWNVHLKDLNEFGNKEAYDVPFGQGKANVKHILAELTLQNYSGYLAIEHEKKEDINNPSPPIKEGLEYVSSLNYFKGYQQILKSNFGRFNKHGWNHYGPGYFSLDPKTGVLKSEGGMGLFWFTEKKYKDFVFELDYKCSKKSTNSGVFIRVPEIPVNNDYIHHSFEIQISDGSKGIHHTGAAYDAEAPKMNAEKQTGEWNHFKISFIGKNIKVKVNGKLVVDWNAEPRGKIRDFAEEGYIGLQNHDSISPVYFKNIYIKEL